MKKRFPLPQMLIALLLAVSVTLLSCGSGDPVETEASDPTSISTDHAVPETTIPKTTTDMLPNIQYNGDEFSILCMKELDNYYMASAEDTGDVLSASVYDRNRAVEERFGIKLNYIPMPGFSAGSAAFMAAITNSVQANDGNFDIVAPNYWYGITLSTQGCYLNLLELPYLDFDQPWWAQGYNDNLQINYQLYACTGDFDLQQYSSLLVTFFNQSLIEAYQMENPYDLVQEGKWTFDKMLTMAQQVTDDLDDNEKYDDKDLYGLVMNLWAIRGLYTAFDFDMVTRSTDDEMMISLYHEKTIEAYDKVYDLINNQQYCYRSLGGYTDNDKMMQIFMNDQALFLGIHLGAAENMREMSSDYGIVPQPKYSEKQENYVTGSVGATIFAIPTSTMNPERSALILEALCMESHKRVVPTYYETVMKYRDARDAQTGEMIDLARRTLYYDFGYVWNTSLGRLYDSWGDSIVNRRENFSSYYASKKDSFAQSLKSLLEALE